MNRLQKFLRFSRNKELDTIRFYQIYQINDISELSDEESSSVYEDDDSDYKYSDFQKTLRNQKRFRKMIRSLETITLNEAINQNEIIKKQN